MRRPLALDRLFASAVVLSTAGTLLLLASGAHGHAVLPTLDLVLDTISFVGCAALTILAWSRFRETGVVAAAYHAAAFSALTDGYAIALLISVQHGESGGSLAEPVDSQVLVFSIARLAAASLFVLAGTLVNRRTYGWHPTWILAAPALAVMSAAVIAALVGPPPAVLLILQSGDASGLPGSTITGAILHFAIAIAFFLGAYASRRLWRAEEAVIDGWIAVGLLYAGFGELIWILFPSAHPGQVSIADLFQLAFVLCLLLGLESSVRVGLRDLRAANLELADLRDSELARVALEERTRLARELHDGLAQDLWLAKLRTSELVGMEDLPASARQVALEAAAAIDVGLGEAREAVAALRTPAAGGSSFDAVIRRTAEEFGDRYGIRVEFTFEGSPEHRIAPRTQAEILRIVQEALTNAARHAQASVVGVRLTIGLERIALRIVDNGRGFDPATVGPGSFGLISMRERAALIGGRLRIASRTGDGTRVVLTAPFARAAFRARVDRA